MESDRVEFCWLVHHGFETPDIDTMKDLGAIWGSWASFQSCDTDNCIADDFSDARKLLDQGLNTKCNLWTHEDNFAMLERPEGLSIYKIGIDKDLIHRDDLVSMALTAARYDIVVCMGFDLDENGSVTDRLERHEHKRYLMAIKHIIKGFPDTQFVFVDLPSDATPDISDLPNFTCDNIQNVLQLLQDL